MKELKDIRKNDSKESKLGWYFRHWRNEDMIS